MDGIPRKEHAPLGDVAPRRDAAGIGLAPGELQVHNRKRLLAGAGGGTVEILSIQPETKKAMDGLSFINGYRLQAGRGWT